jgi:hypothetical protein
MRRPLPFACLLFLAAPLPAAVVTTTADSGPGSLRDAVANAAPGETITFALPLPATIVLTSGEILIAQNLTLDGPGATQLVLSGNDASRVFSIDTGHVAMAGLSIAHGRNDGVAGDPGTGALGGCIRNVAQLDLTDVVVRDCLAQGVAESGPTTPTGASGGAIANIDGSLTLVRCTVQSSVARGGDGTTLAGGPAFGGGIFADAGSELLLIDSVFAGNQAIGGSTVAGGIGDLASGGGLFLRSGDNVVRGSTISGNRATAPSAAGEAGDASGGGMAIENAFLVMTNSTLSGNVADATAASKSGLAQGGGLMIFDGDARLVHVTLTANVATAGGPSPGISIGGGIQASAGSVLLGATILSGSAAATFADYGALAGVVTTSSGYNIVSAPGPSGFAPGVGDDVGNGTDPLLGPLAANGGPTSTHALLIGSPAIDRAPASPACDLATDQRGVARPQGAGCDSGAFERAAADVTSIPTLSATGLALAIALLALAGSWRLAAARRLGRAERY